MYMETEMDLVNNFINNLPKSNKQIVLREIPTSYGRPDILIIRLNTEVIKNLKPKMNNSKFTKAMSYTMTYLYHRRWIKRSTLQEFLGCTESMLNNTIKDLIILDLLDKDGNYIKSKSASEILAIKRIWAYEAKLSHWQYAIEQAERHLWFTREPYILLPQVSENILYKSIKECKLRNIGLSVFSEDNLINTYVKSSKKGVINSPFIWELNNKIIRGEYIGEL